MSRQCPFHKVEISDTQECPLCVLRDERDEAQSQLASATDLLNSWAREMQVPEAHNEEDIKGVIDRLWSNLSSRLFASPEAVPVAETPADNRCTYCGRPTETKMWLHPDCMNRYNLSERKLLRAEAARVSGAPTREEWIFDVARKLEADSELALDLVITRDKLAAASPASGAPTPQAVDLCKRITDYLEGGGLFNPEMAIHDAVRDLLIDCRAELAAA